MSSKYASLARTETSACHFSAKKIRDFSTALGMTKKALTEMNLHCDTGFAVLSDAFPGRARLLEPGCNTCLGRTIPKSGQKFPETEEIFAQPNMTTPFQLNQD